MRGYGIILQVFCPYLFFHLPLQNCLHTNAILGSLIFHHQLPWKIYFPFLCWHLGLARNECIFKNKSCSQNRIIHKVVQCAIEFFLLCPAKNIKIRIPKIIKWIAPPEPFIKLNTDGSSLGNPSLAGVGRLLHNSSGDWISGFSLHMGITSNNIAELGVDRQGLLLAWNLGFKFIHLEIDSMTVLS